MAPLRSIDAPARQRSEESWIEIASRPSSSSLSSATDEIITTGLTVQHDSNLHSRNRRLRAVGHFQNGTGHRLANVGGSSSQEEYEESESESDRVMSSETMSEREDEEEDGDENATAVNYPRSTPRSAPREFQPRPNAFSQAQAQAQAHDQQPNRSPSGTGYLPRRNARPTSSQRQHSYPQHTPYNILAPTYHPDHDEALRASLSTLLSAAAAVRGLPKPGQPRTALPPSSSRLDPTSLQMVPESVILGDVSEEPSSPGTASSSPTSDTKRKASPCAPSATRSSSKDRRAVNKARQTVPMIEDISPTLFTWVMSAGVVVLVSALSFSAGYAIGKETGHAEAALGQMGAAGGDAGRCGKEAAAGLHGGTGLGLRKLGWTGSTRIRV